MKSNFKQDRNYNCGIFASMYVLAKYYNVRRLHPRFLEELAWTTARSGTSHAGIEEIFRHHGIRFTAGAGTIVMLRDITPLIVNFQFEGDGHYGVIIGWCGDEVRIWEPWRAKTFWMNVTEFDLCWYSKRFGSHYYLHPLDKT